MRNINSRKLVNPFAVTAPSGALNAALSLAALAIDKKTDTLVRIIADGDRITFSVANIRSAVSQAKGAAQIAFSLPALTSLVEEFKDGSLRLDADTDHLAVLRCRWRLRNEAAA